MEKKNVKTMTHDQNYVDELVASFNASGEYDFGLCRALCVEVGLEKEWDDADSDNFENVLRNAAEALNVTLYGINGDCPEGKMTNTTYRVLRTTGEFRIKTESDFASIKPGCTFDCCEDPEVILETTDIEEAKNELAKCTASIRFFTDHGMKYADVEEAYIESDSFNGDDNSPDGSIDMIDAVTMDYAHQIFNELMEEVNDMAANCKNAEDLAERAEGFYGRASDIDLLLSYMKKILSDDECDDRYKAILFLEYAKDEATLKISQNEDTYGPEAHLPTDAYDLAKFCIAYDLKPFDFVYDVEVDSAITSDRKR